MMRTLSTHEFLVLAGIIIWTLGLFGGLLPLCCKGRSPKLISSLHMFGGGIFFAASIMHLLPDAVDNKELARLGCADDETTKCEGGDLWAYFFFGLGFLLILCVEQFAHALQEQFSNNASPQEPQPLRLDTPLLDASLQEQFSDNESSQELPPLRPDAPLLDSSDISSTHENTRSFLNEIQLVEIVIFVALSFHSVMEGVAIGSQIRPAWDILLAVIAHKALAAFALGLELQSHGVPRARYYYSIFLFSMMTPIGIGIGCLLIDGVSSSSDHEAKDSIISGICTALSAGTFTFVALMEIIPQELQNKDGNFLKSAALCFGFGLFGLLAKWV